MELEELKSLWTSLDKKLEQQGGLNEQIIKEMLLNKSEKSLSKVTNYMLFSLIFVWGCIPLLIWTMTHTHLDTFKIAVFLSVFSSLLVVAIKGTISFVRISRIDFTESLSKNIQIVQKMNISAKRMAIIAYIVGTLLLLVMAIGTALLYKIELWRWAALAVAFIIAPIAAWWEYKRMYKKNFDSILKSLEELKELEEE